MQNIKSFLIGILILFGFVALAISYYVIFIIIVIAIAFLFGKMYVMVDEEISKQNNIDKKDKEEFFKNKKSNLMTDEEVDKEMEDILYNLKH